MHAVRRRAHRVAATDGTSLNYNPFARTRSRESAASQSHSDTEARASRSGTQTPDQNAILSPANSQSNIALPSPVSPPSEPVEAILRPQMSPIAEALTEASSRTRPKKRVRFKKIFNGSENKEDESLDVEVFDVEDEEMSLEVRRERALKRKIPIAAQLKAIFATNWVSTVLMPCIPAGFAVNYAHSHGVAVFCVNFFAIVPSATMLSTCLNELIIRSDEKVSALLNQTFGNAVQLILSVLLLKSHQVSVLKLSLLGIILSNLLVTTGLSFLLGGINRLEQYYNASLAQTISMLLLLAVTSLVIPTAAHLMTNTSTSGILAQSRGISIVILVSYALWLRFTLYTHRSLFYEPNKKAEKKKSKKLKEGDAVRRIATIGASTAATSGGGVNARSFFRDVDSYDDDECDFDEPSLSLVGAVITLIVSVVLLAFNTQFATDSIQIILQRQKVSQMFLSLIILPLLSNDPMAINMAIHDKMNMSISLALERCMQTCLLLVPLTVLLAWCMGVNDMDLQFDGFPIATMFASIIIVTYVVQEGSSNWLTGALLLKVFIIIALAAFFIR